MKRVLVKNHDGQERIVQASMIPKGFLVVGDYKEPKKQKPKKE